MIWISSLIFQIYFFVSVTVAAILVCLCSLLPYLIRFRIAATWARSMLFVGKTVCGLQYVVEGWENIPDRTSIIMIKHTTVFEAYAQLAIFPPQTWVLKRELLWIPIIGWALAALKCIAINRSDGNQAVNQVINQGKQRLQEGIWVTIFPEGTRMPLGKTRRYGISGAALASQTQIPIVPVAHNAGDFWARRGLKKQPGLIHFCIGPAIAPGDLSAKELNIRVQTWVESRMSEISIGYPNMAAEKRATKSSES